MVDERLIDANALREDIMHYAYCIDDVTSWRLDIVRDVCETLAEKIDEAPTIAQNFNWRPSESYRPTEEEWNVITCVRGDKTSIVRPWWCVAEYPERYPYWMPLPKPPRTLLAEMDGEGK